MKWYSFFLIFSLFFLFLGCSAVGIRSGTEQLGYTVVDKEGSFEIREYDNFLVAETIMGESHSKDSSSNGFRKLFKYISGDNSIVSSEKIEDEASSMKIAMTAPVFMEPDRSQWKMSFVLPNKYNLQNVPIPNNSEVTVKEVKSKRMVVYTFSGNFDFENIEKQKGKLQDWVTKKNLKTKNGFSYAGYDPPWTVPSLRKNEILIEVDTTIRGDKP